MELMLYYPILKRNDYGISSPEYNCICYIYCRYSQLPRIARNPCIENMTQEILTFRDILNIFKILNSMCSTLRNYVL